MAQSAALQAVRKIRQFSEIPGPWPSLPVVGTNWQYWGHKQDSQLHKAFEDKLQKYGPICKEEYQFRRPVVHLFDAEDFPALFRAQGSCPIRPPVEFVCKYRRENSDRYPGVGLSNALGEEWHLLRSTLAPVLKQIGDKATVKDTYGALQWEICQDWVRHLEDQASNSGGIVADIQDSLYMLTLESIFAMCLERRLGCLAGDTRAVELVEATKKLFSSYQKLTYGSPLWKKVPSYRYEEYTNTEDTIYGLTSELLAECSASAEQSLLLKSLMSLPSFTWKDIQLTVMDFIVGGIFSMTQTLTFFIHQIAVHENVQATIYDALQDQENKPGESLASHPYIKACLKETFRLSPSVPGLMRILPQDTVLCDYHIPAGTAVFANSMVACRSELAIPLLIGRNVSCPDLRQELERQEREEQAQQQQLLTYKSLNDSSSDMVDLISTAADRDIEDNEFRGGFGVRLPELGVDIGSMECLLADDELAPSPTPLEDCNKNSSELSIRKLGNEDSLLRTSLRRRRDSNSISSVASLAVPKITVSDHSKKRSSMSSFTASVPSSKAPIMLSSSFSFTETGIGMKTADKTGNHLKDITAANVSSADPHSGEQVKLLWKLSKLAKRWYCQLKEDFSEMRPFEIEDKPLFEVDEFSIKNTTDALNRFDDLFAALVDGPLRDSYNEALRVTQWTYPLQTLLTLIVLLHSLWMDYLVALVLVSLCVSLIRNYMIAQGWIIEKDRMDVDTRRRTNAVRVTKLFQLNLRVVKVFQLLTDGMDKGLALWTWKRPEITGILFGTLAGGALLSVLAPAGLLIKFVGTGLLAKLFLFDYIFFRFPRVRAKYDLLYNWFKELPTSAAVHRKPVSLVLASCV
ncbi:uncharacterized protein LOC111245503 isoform X4 [Varroa destructor]|uniref:Uncharacterized protein n=1 Tax=Varroa destructor TaxID=109461 RepID=A0A7M7JC34_VARDE|nr:uncharacterized protein LOC111245503 isoform X4 [Varroa destructor]